MVNWWRDFLYFPFSSPRFASVENGFRTVVGLERFEFNVNRKVTLTGLYLFISSVHANSAIKNCMNLEWHCNILMSCTFTSSSSCGKNIFSLSPSGRLSSTVVKLLQFPQGRERPLKNDFANKLTVTIFQKGRLKSTVREISKGWKGPVFSWCKMTVFRQMQISTINRFDRVAN